MQSLRAASPSSPALLLWLRAFASTALGVVGQLLFRRFGQGQPEGWPLVDGLLWPTGLGFLVTGVSCYLVAVWLWIDVLRELPLSRAYPLLSLGYPLVYVGAVLLLGEPLTLARTLGTLLVCIGVLLAVAPEKA